MAVDTVERLMGAYGKYQLGLTILVYICKFSIAFNQIAIVFLAPVTKFACNGVDDKCPCSSPDFPASKNLFTNTIIMKWRLICDRKTLVSVTQSLFQLGTLIGSIIFGMAADKFGRRKPLLGIEVVQVIAGVWAAYANNFWFFTFLRFLVGLCVGGNMVITFVILVEYTGAKHREVLSALYQIPFNMGHMMLPLIAYFLRDYSDYTLALTSASFILLPYFCLMPETPRWLLANRQTDAAIACITRVATVNKLPTESIRSDINAYQHNLELHKLVKGTIVDLFRTPNIRRNTICMSMNWLTCAYCFYGVSQYTGHLAGDVFLNVLASATCAGMGTLLSIPLMKIMGRKTILLVTNGVTATCLLLLAFSTNKMLSIVLAVIGVATSFIMFVVVYPYCGELFPTVVRNAAMGYCSMIARIGSMLAPFVVQTRDVAKWLPPILFAIVPLITGVLAFFLPETKGRELLNTLEEAENFTSRKNYVPERPSPEHERPSQESKSRGSKV